MLKQKGNAKKTKIVFEAPVGPFSKLQPVKRLQALGFEIVETSMCFFNSLCEEVKESPRKDTVLVSNSSLLARALSNTKCGSGKGKPCSHGFCKHEPVRGDAQRHEEYSQIMCDFCHALLETETR